MADRFSADIKIGGKISRAIYPELIQKIKDSGAGLNWGECEVGDDFEIKDGEIIHLYDSEARYGEFEELEDFLKENKIQFKRFSSGYFEYLPALYVFDPDNNVDAYITCNDGGSPLFDIETINELISHGETTLKSEIEKVNQVKKFQPNPIKIE